MIYQQDIQNSYNNMHILKAISEVSKILALVGRSYPAKCISACMPPLPGCHMFTLQLEPLDTLGTSKDAMGHKFRLYVQLGTI